MSETVEIKANTIEVDEDPAKVDVPIPAVDRFENLTHLLQARYGPNSKQVEENHWMFEVLTERNRSQIVHLLARAHSSGASDVSRIIAVSPIGPLPQRYDLEQLLRKNATLDVGAICVEDFRNPENEMVSYLSLRASHLLATADLEEIWEMVEKVSRVADELEKDIYARDLH